jgi:group I intron endonuclease
MTNEDIYHDIINPQKLYAEYIKNPSVPIALATSTPDVKKYIYKITNCINGKVYIGQAINPENRFKQHKLSKYNNRLYNSMKKYGIDNFVMEVIFCTTEKFIDYYEIFFIDQYNSYSFLENSNGYNMTRGGSCTDSGSLSIFMKERTKQGKNPFSRGNSEAIKAAERTRELARVGKLNLQSKEHREIVSKTQLQLLESGNHLFSGEDYGKRSSELQRKRIEQGTFHMHQPEMKLHMQQKALKEIAEGTHNFVTVSTCPVCGKSGKGQSMKRWHFDNCGKKKETWNDGIKNYTVYEGEVPEPHWVKGMRPRK